MNSGKDSFSEKARQQGIQDKGLTHSIVTFDMDNDGDLDAFFANMSVYEDKHLGYGVNALYRNDGRGNFNNVTRTQGITNELNDTRGAIALDIDADGWLDLYGVNWGQPCEMYLNNGSGKFRRVHRGADGPSEDTSAKQGVTAADIDNDGDVDIYVSRREARNWLFVNDGRGYFSECAEQYGVDVDGRTNGAAFADIDNDADLDLFVVNYAVNKNVLPYVNVFINNGNGFFTDRTLSYNIKASAYSVVFGDVDNDADLDMLLVNNQEKSPKATHQLYLNDGSGGLTKVSCGLEVPAKDARGAGSADIDNDGDIDFYIACKNSGNVLFRNDSQSNNHYIDVLCTGPQGDLGGFGSKVTVYQPGRLGDPNCILGYQESVSNYSYLCQNQTALHFGLGSFDTCDLRVLLTDGRSLNYRNVPADQILRISDTPSPTRQFLQISGDFQTGNPLQKLDDPFVVRIVNQNGVGVADVPITFTPKTLGIMHEPQPVLSDVDGYARSFYICPEEPGSFEIIATSDQFETKITFHVESVINAVSYHLIKVQGDNQTGRVSQVLDLPFKVQLVDEEEKGIADQEVSFTAQHGGALIEPQPVLTDEEGVARSTFLCGNEPGAYMVQVTAPLVSKDILFFTGSILPDSRNITIGVNYGDLQSGIVGQRLKSPVVVFAVDESGSPVAGIDIQFSVQDSSGYIEGQRSTRITTAQDGKARAVWTLGVTAGPQYLCARYQEQEVVFEARAIPDDPDVIIGQIESAPFYRAGETYIVTYTIKDRYQNSIPDIAFKCSVAGGGGWINGEKELSMQTSINEGVTINWTLGGNFTFRQVIHATVTNHPQVSQDVIVNKVEPPLLDGSFFNVGDSAVADGRDSLLIVLTLKNNHDIPLPGYAVELYVSGIENDLTMISSSSDEEGRFFASLKSTRAEPKRIKAEVPDVGSVPDSAWVTFTKTDKQLNLRKQSGDGQQGTVGRPLSEPIVVYAEYQDGSPAFGVEVLFQVDEISGSLGGYSEKTIVTDSLGQASVVWTLGEKAGPQRLKARAKNAWVQFTAYATPALPANIIHLPPAEFLFRAAKTYPMTFKVCDTFDNGIHDISVRYAVMSGNGSIGGKTEFDVRTDSIGLCTVNWTLGPNHHYINRLRATVENADSVMVDVDIQSLPPSLNQSSISATDSAIADGLDSLFVTVQLKNDDGIALPDYEVDLFLSGSGNLLRPLSRVTDSLGFFYASVQSTVAETKTLTASVPEVGDVPDSLIVTFFPQSAIAARLVKVSGDSQAVVAGRPPAEALVVRAVDDLNRSLANETIEFAVWQDSAAVETIVTKSDVGGYANVMLSPGTKVGIKRVSANLVDYNTQPVYFTITVIAADPASISRLFADSLRVYASDTLDIPVLVRDSFGNPTPGINVIFHGEERDRIFPQRQTTDSTGRARAKIIFGNVVGPHVTKAVVNDSVYIIITTFVQVLNEHLVAIPSDTLFLREDQSIIEVTVQCLDDENRPIEKVPIQFKCTQGAGEFMDSALMYSDSSGYASVRRHVDGDMMSVIQAASPHDSLRFTLLRDQQTSVGSDQGVSYFKLMGNYPNPFNLSTVIPFALPRQETVTIQLFNLNGRLLFTLVNETMPAGRYTVTLDASAIPLSSGVHFCRMQAGEFQAIKPILFLK